MIRAASSTRHSVRRSDPLAAIGAALGCWRSRRALSRLDASHLADIGVGDEEARGEARRAVWDVPTSWLR